MISLIKIETKTEFLEILSKDEVSFLEDWYEDIAIEDGYLCLKDYYRKNYDSNN